MKAKSKTILIATIAVLDCAFGGLVVSNSINTSRIAATDVKTSGNYIVGRSIDSFNEEIIDSVRDKEAPVISNVKDITITVGQNVDFFKGISITDNSKEEVEKKVTGHYDIKKSGVYTLTYEAKDTSNNITTENFKLIVKDAPKKWKGQKLSKANGSVNGPSGKETYYNLNMDGCVKAMRRLGYSASKYKYWVRADGVKMFGDYVMVAASLDIRPKGTLVETSLGTGIVVDTGGFAKKNKKQLDIAVSW